MNKADAAAAILWIGATLYAIFGGADFGGGMWDLLAGDARKGARARARIQASLTPVWEANHVWLIFILVVLWTAFPEAFGAIMSTLYVPLALAALGIVLRGAGFAFRKAVDAPQAQRALGACFALSSVMTPFFMGVVVGAIASGNVPGEGNGDAFSSWIEPLPLLTGAIFVASGAYLAAVFLIVDSRRAGDAELEEYFAGRALAAAAIAGAFSLAGVFALQENATYVFERLTAEGLPLMLLSGACGLAVLAMLARGVRRGLRPLAVLTVAALIWGWGVGQHPYLLPTSLEISEAAAPGPTLTSVLVVFGVAAATIVPALALLYALTQRDVVGE
jgi:cytochrome bd ubiquinol oxidase subunit II